MKSIICALALGAVACQTMASVISWRIDGTAKTSAGPLLPRDPISGDPVLTPLPDEPHAWEAFSYDTDSQTYLSAAFDFGTYEGHSVGPIEGLIGVELALGMPPRQSGYLRTEWATTFGPSPFNRTFWVGTDFGSMVAGNMVVAYNFTATSAAFVSAVPEPATLALVLVALTALPVVRRLGR